MEFRKLDDLSYNRKSFNIPSLPAPHRLIYSRFQHKNVCTNIMPGNLVCRILSQNSLTHCAHTHTDTTIHTFAVIQGDSYSCLFPISASDLKETRRNIFICRVMLWAHCSLGQIKCQKHCSQLLYQTAVSLSCAVYGYPGLGVGL